MLITNIKTHFSCMSVKSGLLVSSELDEKKLKGVIYFQAIEEVYYDHLRTATSVSSQTQPEPAPDPQ